MIGAARSPGLREDKDALLVVHEGVGLANVRTAGAGLDRKTHISVVARPRDNATRAPRHLGDRLGPEMLDDLIERARHRRQRGELLDHRSEEHTSELQSLLRIQYA